MRSPVSAPSSRCSATWRWPAQSAAMSLALTAADFQLLFESVPGLYLVLTPDLTIVTCTDAFAHATLTRREVLIGRNIFDLFADNADGAGGSGVFTMRASLERVLRCGEPDSVSVQRYGIRCPDDVDGAFEQRLWSVSNTPVFDAYGSVTYIRSEVVDVTEFGPLHEPKGSTEKLLSDALEEEKEKSQALVLAYEHASRISACFEEAGLPRSLPEIRGSHSMPCINRRMPTNVWAAIGTTHFGCLTVGSFFRSATWRAANSMHR